jgi:hypothetical protein
MTPEQTAIWLRMAVDRQLLGLKHANLWVSTLNTARPNQAVMLSELLTMLVHNASHIQTTLNLGHEAKD